MFLPVIGIWRGYEEHESGRLKISKIINWAHTLITSGVIKSMDKFPSRDESAEEIWLFQTDRKAKHCSSWKEEELSDRPCEGKWNVCVL